MVDYTNHFVPDPLPLLRRAALYLPNNTYQPDYVDPERVIMPDGVVHEGVTFTGLGHRVMGANPIPTTIDLADAHVNAELTRWTLRPMYGEGAGNAFNAYFLPWDVFGSATEMTLPDPPEANFFFTSALSGCSVMVTNTFEQPTIYHCGIDAAAWGQGGRVARPADVPGFWRGYVRYLEHIRDAGARPIIAEVNKDFYVTTPGVNYHYPTDLPAQNRQTTQYAIDFMVNHLTGYTSRMVPNQPRMPGGEADPWGVFFGVYAGGRWSFYLQENMLVKHAGKRARGLFKAIRRRVNPVYTREMLQSLPWRLRRADVVEVPIDVEPPEPVYTDRDWTWDEVKDGNLWLPPP